MPLFVLIALCAPVYVQASVFINEVMYDISGADNGREWIEIINDGEQEVDISGWKLFEADTNHGLTLITGNVVLLPYSYAVIAANAEKFIIDFPSFSGTLFDSSFSLNNTGETLVLRDKNLTSIDTLNYLNKWGAAGDGHSLQKVLGEWKNGSPTPGTVNKTKAAIVPNPIISKKPESKIVSTVPLVGKEMKKEEYILPSKSVSMVPDSKEIAATSSQLVAQTMAPKSSSFLPWLFGIIGLIGVPLLSLFFLPKKQKTEADEIEIIE